jgi:hypothetical protein
MKKKLLKGIEFLKSFFILALISYSLSLSLALINNPFRQIFLSLYIKGIFGFIGSIIFMIFAIILSALFIFGFYKKLDLAWYSAIIFFTTISLIQLGNILLFLNIFSLMVFLLSGSVIYYLIKNKSVFFK